MDPVSREVKNYSGLEGNDDWEKDRALLKEAGQWSGRKHTSGNRFSAYTVNKHVFPHPID